MRTSLQNKADKARNIYIDTTGFCEDAKRRVDCAIDALCTTSHRYEQGFKVFGIDEDGDPIARSSIFAMEGNLHA